MYIGIQHVSINVTDLDKARQFYGKVLGLQEIRRPAFKSQGAWYEIGLTQLHLIVNNGKTLRGTMEVDNRDGHFAFRLHYIQDIIENLKQAALPYQEDASSLTGWHQVYVTDPDGNIIEFNA